MEAVIFSHDKLFKHPCETERNQSVFEKCLHLINNKNVSYKHSCDSSKLCLMTLVYLLTEECKSSLKTMTLAKLHNCATVTKCSSQTK